MGNLPHKHNFTNALGVSFLPDEFFRSDVCLVWFLLWFSGHCRLLAISCFLRNSLNVSCLVAVAQLPSVERHMLTHMLTHHTFLIFSIHVYSFYIFVIFIVNIIIIIIIIVAVVVVDVICIIFNSNM